MPKTPPSPPLPSQAEAFEIVSSVLNQLQRQRLCIDGYKDTYAVAAMLDRVRAEAKKPRVEAEPVSKYDQALTGFGRAALDAMEADGDWSMDTLNEIALGAYGRGLAKSDGENFEVIPEEQFKGPSRGVCI